MLECLALDVALASIGAMGAALTYYALRPEVGAALDWARGRRRRPAGAGNDDMLATVPSRSR